MRIITQRNPEFTHIIKEQNIRPEILLEIISDSCSLDYDYLVDCFYGLRQGPDKASLRIILDYLNQVFYDGRAVYSAEKFQLSSKIL